MPDPIELTSIPLPFDSPYVIKTGRIQGRVPYPYLCLLYTSPSPRDKRQSRMPSSA